MGQSGAELLGVDRFETEVVEQVLPQFELRQLVVGDDHHHRSQGHLPLAQVPAEEEGPDGVLATADHRARPSVLGLVAPTDSGLSMPCHG